MRSRLLPTALAVLVAALVAALASCGGDNTLRRAFEAYEAQVRPLMDKEQEVFRRIGALLADEQDRRYFEHLEKEGRPFYEGFRRQVAEIEPGHPQIEAAHERLLQFAEARLEYVNGSLQVTDLTAHLRNVERVYLAEGEANAANRAYLEELGNQPPDARFTEITQLNDAFTVKYMRRMAAGEIGREEVEAHIRRVLLPGIERIRNTKYADDKPAQLLRDCVVRFQDYVRTILDELTSIDVAVTSKRRTQRAVDRGEEQRLAFLDELKRLRRLR